MRNKFAGTCYRCNGNVLPGKGYFERHQGKFRVQHVTCAHRYHINTNNQCGTDCKELAEGRKL
jgi:hypothetical protein